MILDNASSSAVNPHFLKLFDLIEKSLDDAKVRTSITSRYSDTKYSLGMAENAANNQRQAKTVHEDPSCYYSCHGCAIKVRFT